MYSYRSVDHKIMQEIAIDALCLSFPGTREVCGFFVLFLHNRQDSR